MGYPSNDGANLEVTSLPLNGEVTALMVPSFSQRGIVLMLLYLRFVGCIFVVKVFPSDAPLPV